MSLSDDDYTELQAILQSLEPELPKLYSAAQGFVRDQIEREKQYGQDMRVSPKQFAWLRKLNDEFGSTVKVAKPMTDDEARDDLDDEIPF